MGRRLLPDPINELSLFNNGQIRSELCGKDTVKAQHPQTVTSLPVTTVPAGRPNSSPILAWMAGAV